MQKYSELLDELREIQQIFADQYGVNDIYSNSKIYEIMIANALDHDLIPGHAGSRDAKNEKIEFEYKHFKETSSNHSWTFNDFSDSTIAKLDNKLVKVIFAHVNDLNWPPKLDWYYEVSGKQVSDYLKKYTRSITNNRKMINVSPNQIETRLQIFKVINSKHSGKFDTLLERIFVSISKLEKLTNVSGILTSNKFWEVVVAEKLNHKVNSEQGGREGAHDASDSSGSWYEYKVGISTSWNFQDISDAVLQKYEELNAVVCAQVDKQAIGVKQLIEIDPSLLIPHLKSKLKNKEASYKKQGKNLRRKAVSITKNELLSLGGKIK